LSNQEKAGEIASRFETKNIERKVNTKIARAIGIKNLVRRRNPAVEIVSAICEGKQVTLSLVSLFPMDRGRGALAACAIELNFGNFMASALRAIARDVDSSSR
jgi:hypothetical protein